MFKHIQLVVLALCALLVLPAAAQVPSYVPTDGLVGWWPFNGNANDESGNGNDGVVNGATLTEDQHGNSNACYNFSDCQFIDLGMENVNFLESDFSISLWFVRNSENIGYLISKRYSENYSNFWQMRSTDFAINETSQNDLASVTFSSPINEWQNFTAVRNASSLKLYVNGILQDSTMNATVLSIINNSPIIVGAVNAPISGTVGCHDGKIDDIAIYNRALTEQEIQNIYTGTTSPPCVSLPSNLQQGLVGYWPFCGNANDESGNGNDGVVNGATLTEDRFGNALSSFIFDGASNYIELPLLSEINNLPQLSVSVWLNSDYNYGELYRTILAHWIESNIGSGSVGLQLAVGGVGTEYEGGFGAAMTAGFGFWSNNNLLTPDIWAHAVLIFDGSQPDPTQRLQLYINGTFQGHVGDSSIPEFTGSSAEKTVIGASVGPTGGDNVYNHYAGSLDDIGIWNRALTPEEVQELYTLEACTFTVYDTLTVYETVYDTVYTYETIYDTVTTYVTVTDTLLIDITFTGIEGQPSWLNTVTVFPNPASDHITIDYGNFALMAGYNTIITDAAGATVYSSAVNSQQVEIDINAWGAMGVYYMSVYDASGALVAVRHIVLE